VYYLIFADESQEGAEGERAGRLYQLLASGALGERASRPLIRRINSYC